MTARINDHLWIEEIVQLVEAEASCELYGLLKRPDEKHVTERAYDNPKFVEDMVRDVAARLSAEPRIFSYVVESENFESIHNHSRKAWAVVAKPPGTRTPEAASWLIISPKEAFLPPTSPTSSMRRWSKAIACRVPWFDV